MKSGLATSKGEAKRKIAEGAVRLDGVQAKDENASVNAPAKLSLGRKRHALLEPDGS